MKTHILSQFKSRCVDLVQLFLSTDCLKSTNDVVFLDCSMPCEVNPRFVLLYGSQKGQAQSIAEGVAEEAEEHGLVAEPSCLEHKEKVTTAHCNHSSRSKAVQTSLLLHGCWYTLITLMISW